ncbi:MAG: hypothetical protein WAK82_20290, partial [Streptosporangiaceae bacterium]
AGGPGPDPAAETAAADGAPWDSAGWDAGAASTTTTANGHHSAGSDGHGPFGTAYAGDPYTEAPHAEASYAEDTYTEDTYTEDTYIEPVYTEGADNPGSMPDPAGSITPAQDGGSVWLPERAPEAGDSGAALAPGDGDFEWLKPPGAGHEGRPGESNVMWSEVEEQATPVPAEPVAGEPRPWQQDSIMKPPPREDFWATPGPAPSDLQPPAVTQASWTAPDEATPAPPAALPVPPPAVADPAPAQAQVHPQGPAHDQAPGQTQVAVPQPRKPDRLFSVKLIVVIIIAALIGSALVLLLK